MWARSTIRCRRGSSAVPLRGAAARSISRPGEVRPWAGGAAPPIPARNRLISLALRPAPVTDRWRAEGAGWAIWKPALARADADRGARSAGRGAGDRADPARGRRGRAGGGADHPRPAAGAAGHRRARPLAACAPTTAPAGRWRCRRRGASAAGGGLAAAYAGHGRGAGGAAEESARPFRAPARPASAHAARPGAAAAPARAGLSRRAPLRALGGATRAGPGWPAGWRLSARGRAAPLAEPMSPRTWPWPNGWPGGPAEGTGELWARGRGGEAQALMASWRARPAMAAHERPPTMSRCSRRCWPAQSVREPVDGASRHPHLGTLEARVQGADLVVAAGLNEGVWPEARARPLVQPTDAARGRAAAAGTPGRAGGA
jgi:ATP-dependent helicase/nuclease subunit B